MITSLILPFKIIIFNCFVTKQCIKSISSEATVQAEVNGIEWGSSPVVCGLCQVVAAGSEGSCEVTDYYWISDGLSVCRQHNCRSAGDGEMTDKKTLQFIPSAFS